MFLNSQSKYDTSFSQKNIKTFSHIFILKITLHFHGKILRHSKSNFVSELTIKKASHCIFTKKILKNSKSHFVSKNHHIVFSRKKNLAKSTIFSIFQLKSMVSLFERSFSKSSTKTSNCVNPSNLTKNPKGCSKNWISATRSLAVYLSNPKNPKRPKSKPSGI